MIIMIRRFQVIRPLELQKVISQQRRIQIYLVQNNLYQVLLQGARMNQAYAVLAVRNLCAKRQNAYVVAWAAAVGHCVAV